MGFHSQLMTIAHFWGLNHKVRSQEDLERLVTRLELSRGPERREELVDVNLSQVLETVFLKNANYQHTAFLMRRIRDFETEDSP